MLQQMSSYAAGVKWNLSDLYQSPQDINIEADLKLAEEKALAFEKTYKPYFEPSQYQSIPLVKLLSDYKEYVTILTKPGVYAHLYFSEHTLGDGRGAFLQKIETCTIDINNHLVFFEVGWNKMPAEIAESLMKDPAVQSNLHYLKHLRIYAPHTLQEGEEKIMAMKNQTGTSAFGRLFDEVINNIAFTLEIEGKPIKLNESQVLSRLHSKVREERKEAAESLAEGLRANTHILTYIYNMVLSDHRLNLKIRKFQHPMQPRNLSNETDLESVLNLVKSVKTAYPMAQRYYELKRRLLGLDKFYDYDRYAPLEAGEDKVDFKLCKDIVLSGYFGFSEEAGKIAEMFFKNHWIDAEIRDGKRGGGFCCQTTPDLHPYILVNYTGSLRDVMTVAHEIGHGLHQYLAGRSVGILESDAPLTLAETASVFGEMVVFEKIMEKEKEPKKRLALLMGKIDDQFATVFRQIAMTDFELQAHEAGQKQGELPETLLNDFWMNANESFYGKSVMLSEGYRHGWKYIPHFVHTPFYCYAYAFAQLYVLSLYQKYKENRNGFIPKYFDILSLGGSRRPEEIAKIAGLDLKDPKFWEKGLDLLEAMVKEAEKSAPLG